MVKAAVWNGSPDGVEIADVELRALGALDVHVDMTASVACITDVITFGSEPYPPGSPLPQIPGHGGVGIVAALGADVTRVGVGDTVLISASPWCGVCYACLKGRPDQCGNLVFLGPPHTLSDGQNVYPHSSIGSYAEEVIVPEIAVVPLETTAPHEALAVLADGGAGGLGAAFKVAPIQPGAIVGVVGCGMTGLSYIQAARLLGAERILAIDPRPERRRAALRFGATEVFDAADPELVETVKNAAGGYPAAYGDKRGVEFAFESTSDARAVETAFAITRPTGDVILAGVPFDFRTATVAFPAMALSMEGKQLHGCQWGETNLLHDIPRWARLLEDGRINMSDMVSRTYAVTEANEALTAVGRYELLAAVLVPAGV